MFYRNNYAQTVPRYNDGNYECEGVSHFLHRRIEQSAFVESFIKCWHVFFNKWKKKTMADDKNLRDNRDRSRVAGSEDYEVQHLAEQLNVSNEEVRKAIEKVGNNREKLEEYLKNNRGNR